MFTGRQSQILAVLIENPQQEFSLSEIGRFLQAHPGVFRRGLVALEADGLVLSRRNANQRLFRINVAHPFSDEVRSIIRKTYGVEGMLKKAVGAITGIKTAFIYGSYARDRMRADSDIDLLAVLNDRKAEDRLVLGLGKAEKALGREVNYKFYLADEFAEKIRRKDPFLARVLSDKVILLKGVL